MDRELIDVDGIPPEEVYVTYGEHFEQTKVMWSATGSNELELEPKNPDTAILPLFRFPNAEELQEFVEYVSQQAHSDKNARISYKEYVKADGPVSVHDLKRMKNIGTHKLDYIVQGKYTHTWTRLELTHIDEALSVRCDILPSEKGPAKKLIDYYADKLERVGAGGHNQEAEDEN